MDGHPSQEEVVVDRQCTVVVHKQGSVAWKEIENFSFLHFNDTSFEVENTGIAEKRLGPQSSPAKMVVSAKKMLPVVK